jgi:hypothetical protein
MPIERIRQGGPLSEARGTCITPPFGLSEAEEIKAMIRRAVRANTFDGRVSEFETWAITTLQKAGLPIDPQTKQPWPELEAYEAPEWFARELLFLIDEIRGHIAAARADLAACVSVQLGLLSMAVGHKFAWERHAVRGRKNKSTLEGNRDGHNKRRRDETERLAEQARAIAMANPKLEYGALQRKVASKLPKNPRTGELVSLRTVRRLLAG